VRIVVATIAVIGVIAAFAGMMYLRFSGDTLPRVSCIGCGFRGSSVVLVSRDIPAGTRIERHMVGNAFREQRAGDIYSDVTAVAGYSYSGVAAVVGKVARVDLSAGEEVTSDKVAVVFASWRGYPAVQEDQPPLELGISPLTRDGERVSPGDWVDIMAAYDSAGTAITLLENVKVVSTRDLPPGYSRGPENLENVVLAVGPEQASRWLERQKTAIWIWLAFPVQSVPPNSSATTY